MFGENGQKAGGLPLLRRRCHIYSMLFMPLFLLAEKQGRSVCAVGAYRMTECTEKERYEWLVPDGNIRYTD